MLGLENRLEMTEWSKTELSTVTVVNLVCAVFAHHARRRDAAGEGTGEMRQNIMRKRHESQIKATIWLSRSSSNHGVHTGFVRRAAS